MAGHETQASIEAWRRETFGPPASLARMAARANEEMAELLRALTADAGPEAVLAEAADVAIVLYGVAELARVDLAPLARSARRRHRPRRTATLASEAQAANSAMCSAMGMVLLGGGGLALPACLAGLLLALERVAALCDGELGAAVDGKMTVNRGRTWRLTDKGHGRHVGAGDGL